MKIKINRAVEPKEFKPVAVILTIESIQELRLLFHTFNRGRLKDVIARENYFSGYLSGDEDVAKSFGKGYTELKEVILDLGYKL